MTAVGSRYRVVAALRQVGDPYRLRLPVTFYRHQVSQDFQMTLSRREDSLSFLLDFQPEELVIDEDYEVFRKLTPEEDPVTFERLFASGPALKVLPPVPSQIFAAVAEAFRGQGISLEVAGSGEMDRIAPNPLLGCF